MNSLFIARRIFIQVDDPWKLNQETCFVDLQLLGILLLKKDDSCGTVINYLGMYQLKKFCN